MPRLTVLRLRPLCRRCRGRMRREDDADVGMTEGYLVCWSCGHREYKSVALPDPGFEGAEDKNFHRRQPSHGKIKL